MENSELYSEKTQKRRRTNHYGNHKKTHSPDIDRLRDMGTAFLFDVDYDAATRTMIVTTQNYLVPEPSGKEYYDAFPSLLDFGTYTNLVLLQDEPDIMDDGAYMYPYYYKLDYMGNDYTFDEFYAKLLEPYLAAISKDGIKYVRKTSDGSLLYEGKGVSLVIMFDMIMDGTCILDIKAI